MTRTASILSSLAFAACAVLAYAPVADAAGLNVTPIKAKKVKTTVEPVPIGDSEGRCATSFASYTPTSYYGICYAIVFDCDHVTPYQDFTFEDFSRYDCEQTAVGCSELHDRVCSGIYPPQLEEDSATPIMP